ncbi:S-adenosyl-L-methionine-dependent methyltransferase [Echria macrotheca]|uniref:S-adenosyl-L-methionine-dependent methyltransferase n=1 Tax=Echria macrotheca TaxID=438768 RepID=A0AAJ0BBW6_9PEZI|nr:S-adenosyl-L-methionine-dependent methyltransferase [Echria macrotheca]
MPSPSPPRDNAEADEALRPDEDEVDLGSADDDADSAYGAGSVNSATTSVTSSVMRYRMENGRRYHAYKEGKYVLPNDETENERLDLQHHIWTFMLDNHLHLCPAGKDKPLRRVLDAGTGTGIWAIDFADEHPEAEVVGVDLSPIQPSYVPPNITWFVDDLEEPWTFVNKFDFIYTRMLTGSISDWPKFFQQCFDNLAPGGWLEVPDITFPVMCDDDTFRDGTPLKQWSDHMLAASYNLQRPLDSAKSYAKQMADVGFVNVTEKKFKWPGNGWPKDRKHKELGVWSYENIAGGLQGLSMALFTRGLGWSAEQLEVFLAGVRKDMKDTRIHAYYSIYIVYAQKPE